MKGMRLVIGIIVSACVGKTMGAIPMLMNVEAIKGRNVGWCIEGQMEEFRVENDSFIWGIIKFDNSGNVWVGWAPVYQSVRVGRCIHHILTNGEGIRKFIHRNPKYFLYSICRRGISVYFVL